MKEAKEDFLAGKDQYKFMRGFGMSVCLTSDWSRGISFQISNKTLSRDWFGVPSRMPSATTKALMERRAMSDWMIVDFAIGEEELQGDRPVAYISSGVSN